MQYGQIVPIKKTIIPWEEVVSVVVREERWKGGRSRRYYPVQLGRVNEQDPINVDISSSDHSEALEIANQLVKFLSVPLKDLCGKES